MQFISSLDVKKRLDEQTLHLIDIREPYEREICFIDNSSHIPMNEVEKIKQTIQDCDHESVLICKSGKRAEATANFIEKELNISNLFVLQGGILEWIEKIDNQLEIY